MTEDLLPAPQRRRGLQRLREEPLTEGIEASGTRRIRGIAAQTVLYRPARLPAGHADRRKIKNEVETLALDGQRPRRRTHHRRRTKSIGSWTPTG
ncbi:hypothetical protein ACFVZD_04655 [Streptomyces sp. NPDC058287]|uniref:hypothetical protein n=1 Tax=unclassified Streptomyces TaxID=2593676 RepID=UPI0036EEE4C5